MTKKLAIIILLFLGIAVFAPNPFFLHAQNVFFNIDHEYDAQNREAAEFSLVVQGEKAFFYVDKSYFSGLKDKVKFQEDIKQLAQEFDDNIYPKLTILYGSEWSPGIDNQKKIYIALHPMKSEAAGYFREKDEYPKIQIPASNEKEIIFLNPEFISSPLAKSYLAHEFSHLIIFYQKNMLLGIDDAIWLIEMRADYAPTFLGYNNILPGSYLEKRVKKFSAKPTGSLTEWGNETADYGTVSLFAHYLVDHYGLQSLVTTLHSKKSGIEAINEYLVKNNFRQDFAQIFTNWSIANLVNDCSVGQFYCYKNPVLKNFKVVPATNFLPSRGDSTLSFFDSLNNWSARWYKIIGGNSNMEFSFKGNGIGKFVVPYMLEDGNNDLTVGFLDFKGGSEAKKKIQNFGKDYNYFAFLPSLQNMEDSFGQESSFNWTVISAKNLAADMPNPNDNGSVEERVRILSSQIEMLQDRLIVVLREKIIDLQNKINLLSQKK